MKYLNNYAHKQTDSSLHTQIGKDDTCYQFIFFKIADIGKCLQLQRLITVYEKQNKTISIRTSNLYVYIKL